MEDQFGGRTDDDLFYDDFEPVEDEVVVAVSDAPDSPIESLPVQPAPVLAQSEIRPPQRQEKREVAQPPPKLRPARGLASSRFADKPAPEPNNQPISVPTPEVAASAVTEKPAVPLPEAKPPPPKSSPSPAPAALPAAVPPAKASSPPQQPATPPTKTSTPNNAEGKPAAKPQGNKQKPRPNGGRPGRIQSGANPRKKLTDEELTAKMEKMKLLAAEKTRKFEKAEKDQKEHEQAYARGMEEARKKRAEDAERRRRNEEERRKLDDERAKNRERKLKAMSMKEGAWDQGKEAMAEEEGRRRFRGANGGIRGSRAGGLAGSRFARDGESPPDSDRSDGRSQGRGRGRGRVRGNGNGRGRGGRRSSDNTPNKTPTDTPSPSLKATAASEADFPSLPAGEKKIEPAEKVEQPALTLQTAFFPRFSGKWDDEMEEYDEQQRAKAEKVTKTT